MYILAPQVVWQLLPKHVISMLLYIFISQLDSINMFTDIMFISWADVLTDWNLNIDLINGFQI